MSDGKRKRAALDSAHGDIAAGEAIAPQSAPIVAPEAAAEPAAAAAISTEVIRSAAATAHQVPISESAATLSGDAWAVCAEMQAALARSIEAAALEMTRFTRSAIAAATDAATAMLGARTLAESVEINAGFFSGQAGAVIEGSFRLSEIGVKAMTDASRPFLERLGAERSGARAR